MTVTSSVSEQLARANHVTEPNAMAPGSAKYLKCVWSTELC